MSALINQTSPFLSSYLPLFEQITISKSTYSVVQDLIDTQKKKFKEFETGLTKKTYTFSDIFDTIDVIDYPMDKTYGVISHLSSVSDSKEIRDLKDHFRNDIVELGKMVGYSKPLYKAIKMIKSKDTNEKRTIQLTIDGMERGGVNLTAAKQKKMVKIDKHLSELSSKLNENVLDATKSFKKVVTDKNVMKNVPLWAKELWSSESPTKGPWTITMSGPSFMAAMQHIPDSSIREEIYMAYISKAANNEEIIVSILDNMLERSKILGFDNYTQLSLSTKMADKESTILKMLDDLKDVSLPCAVKEYEELREYAEKESCLESVEPWDMPYWSERMREEKFKLKVEDLKPYLCLDNVLRELFSIANRLFGIFIEEREEKVEKWHKDVLYYDVFEGDSNKGTIIAGFYLDPFVREETKRSGAWMDSCVDKNRALGHTIPVAYLVCNGSPPSKDKPSLLSFSDVETLFHEFGHGLQHMLTRVDISGISGISGIEWDAVELPSQFMENWCYDETTLKRMAVHYKTGKQMPKKMYTSLVEQKNYGAGMAMMRQISFSKLDLYLYSNWEKIREEKRSIWDIQKEIFTENCPYKRYLDQDRFLCSFQHIFAGYSAGYYSYKWAEIMSADSFGMFEENPKKQSEIGRRFRDTVLSNGGSKPAMDTFVEFRGRKPEVEALLRHNGLK